MRRFIVLVVSAAMLVGACFVAFGVPGSVSARIGSDADMTGASGEDGAAPGNATSASGPGSGGTGRPGRMPGSTTVVTTALEIRPHDSVLNAIGTASALRSVEVVSDAAGTVTEANLMANREVAAGDVLVRLDARTETLNLDIAQAELDRARDTVLRYERLRASGNSTVTDVTLSEARVDERLAEAQVGLAQVALDDRTIRAPIDGRLGLSDIDVGDVLAADSIVGSIDQTDALLVEFEVPERVIGLLAEAEEIRASTSTLIGRVFEGEVVAFDSRVDDVTRSVTVKARIENPDGLLWPGMTFSVRLIQQSEPLPALPSTAITWSRDGSAVWVDADGAAQQVPVTILYRRGDTVWIDADLAEGTMVVTEGAQKLREGSPISTPPDAGNRGETGRGGVLGEAAADTPAAGARTAAEDPA